mgnify:FL=1
MTGPRARVILVVDDDEADLLALTTLLEGSGYAVAQARSGRQAVAIFLEYAPELVLTDMAMSDGDGIDLMRWLGRIRPDVPIVAVTGMGEETVRRALEAGASSVVAKPVDREVMLGAVRGALTGSSARSAG